MSIGEHLSEFGHARYDAIMTSMTSPEQSPEPQEPAASPPLTATWTFLGVIVAIYLLTSAPHFQAVNDSSALIGVFIPSAFAAGEYWRLLTAPLMHANPGHLFNNALGIYIFGTLLEPILGARRMWGLYFISGVASMLLSFYMLPNSPTLGASGIDYGLIGAYVMLVLLFRRLTDKALYKQELRSALIFMVIYVVWNQVESPNANLWGHVGGLIGGMTYALLLYLLRPRRRPAPQA